MSQRSPTKKKMLQWFQENKLFPEMIDNDKYEFLITVQRGQVKMEVYRPNGKKYIHIGTRIVLPKEKENLFTPEKKSEFSTRLWELLPSLNIDIRYLQPSGVAIYEQIFDDGFTYDRLSITLRKITIAGLRLFQHMQSILGLDSGQEVSSADEQSEPNYYA